MNSSMIPSYIPFVRFVRMATFIPALFAMIFFNVSLFAQENQPQKDQRQNRTQNQSHSEKCCEEEPSKRVINIVFDSLCAPNCTFKPICLDNVNDIKQGEFYQVRISGIYLNLYEVFITNSDSVISTALKTPSPWDFNFDAISKALAGIKPATTVVPATPPPTILTMSATANLQNLTVQQLVRTPPSPFKIYQDSVLANLNGVETIVVALREKVDSLNLLVAQTRLTHLGLLPNPPDTITAQEALAAYLDVREAVKKLRESVVNLCTSYEDEAKKHEQELKNDTLKAVDAEIKSRCKKLTEALDAAREAVTSEKIDALVTTLASMEKNSSTYCSLPLQFTGEQTRIRVSLKPRGEKSLFPSYATSFVFPAFRKGYAGLGLSYYVSGLRDDAISIRTTITESPAAGRVDTTYSLIREKQPQFEMGMAMLLRIGHKFNSSLSPGMHISLGAGASISNTVKPRFFFGGGISLFHPHSLVFDIGGVMGHENTRSQGYNFNSEYRAKPESATVSALNKSYFISVGYMYRL